MFTYFLLEGLKGGDGLSDDDGNVTTRLLGEYVYDRITDLPPQERENQEPIIKTETVGKIILAHHSQLEKPKGEDIKLNNSLISILFATSFQIRK